MDQTHYDLTVFSVATDRYINHWSRMVNSYLVTNGSSVKVQWIVFTDKQNEIDPELISKLGGSLLVIDTPHQEWPFPTLLRYQYLLRVSEQVNGRIIMHLDADMLFVGDLKLNGIEESLGIKGINLVRHPGYYRPRRMKKLLFYAKNFNFLARDVKTQVLFGGLGTWERNKFSRAFVQRRSRENYVCGGVWLGKKAEILKLCKELSLRVNEDLESGIIAVFHDESHLNWYQAKNHLPLLNPELCYDPSYPQLKNLRPKIFAVDKNAEGKWVR